MVDRYADRILALEHNAVPPTYADVLFEYFPSTTTKETAGVPTRVADMSLGYYPCIHVT